jgi:hypothetical protein
MKPLIIKEGSMAELANMLFLVSEDFGSNLGSDQKRLREPTFCLFRDINP